MREKDLAPLPPVLDNPYWTLMQPMVSKTKDPTWGTFVVGGLDFGSATLKDLLNHPIVKRREWCSAFAWTITAPQTVSFVAEHCTKRVIDPLAGNGYWAYLLGQLGIRVRASDIAPPTKDTDEEHNIYHHHTACYVPVMQVDAVHAATFCDTGDTLLLAWPPYNDPTGFKTLSAFPGNRLIYIGEGAGGCTGDDVFHALLESEWTEVAAHAPVQFYGLHDYVMVYDRNQS